MLRRQTSRRFGDEAGEQLHLLLEKINDAEQLAEVGEWIIDCDSGDELIARVKHLVNSQ